MATRIRNREVRSDKRKTNEDDEAQNITESNQPSVSKETVTAPLFFNLEYANNSNKAIEQASHEALNITELKPLKTARREEKEKSEEISPQLARLCKLLGVDHTKVKVSVSKLPWESEEASTPNRRNVVPEFTQAELFPGEGWRF